MMQEAKHLKWTVRICMLVLIVMSVYDLKLNYCLPNVVVFIIAWTYILVLVHLALKGKFDTSRRISTNFITAHIFAFTFTLQYLFEAIFARSIELGILYVAMLVLANLFIYVLAPIFRNNIDRE